MIARFSSLLFIAAQTKTVRRLAEGEHSGNHSSLNMTSLNVTLNATQSTESQWEVPWTTDGYAHEAKRHEAGTLSVCKEPPDELIVPSCREQKTRLPDSGEDNCTKYFEKHDSKGFFWGGTRKYFACKSLGVCVKSSHHCTSLDFTNKDAQTGERRHHLIRKCDCCKDKSTGLDRGACDVPKKEVLPDGA